MIDMGKITHRNRSNIISKMPEIFLVKYLKINNWDNKVGPDDRFGKLLQKCVLSHFSCSSIPYF